MLVFVTAGVGFVRGPAPPDHRKVRGLELIRMLIAPLERPRQAVAHVVVGQGDVGGQVQLEIRIWNSSFERAHYQQCAIAYNDHPALG